MVDEDPAARGALERFSLQRTSTSVIFIFGAHGRANCIALG